MTDRRFKKLIDLSTTCQNWQLWQRKLIQNPIQRPVLHLLLLLSAPHFHCFLPSGQRSTGATVHLSDSLSHTHSYLSYTHKHTHTHWESSCSVSSHRRQNTEPIKAEGNQWNSRAPTSRVGRLKRRLTKVARKQQLRQYTSKKKSLNVYDLKTNVRVQAFAHISPKTFDKHPCVYILLKMCSCKNGTKKSSPALIYRSDAGVHWTWHLVRHSCNSQHDSGSTGMRS